MSEASPVVYKVEVERQVNKVSAWAWLRNIAELLIPWGLGSLHVPEHDELWRVKMVTGRWSKVVYATDWTFVYETAQQQAAELRDLVERYSVEEVDRIVQARRVSH
jgi:hypothetical protein